MPQEVIFDFQMPHAPLVDWILRYLDTRAVVHHQVGHSVQWEADLVEDVLQVEDSLCRLSSSDVLRFVSHGLTASLVFCLFCAQCAGPKL